MTQWQQPRRMPHSFNAYEGSAARPGGRIRLAKVPLAHHAAGTRKERTEWEEKRQNTTCLTAGSGALNCINATCGGGRMANEHESPSAVANRLANALERIARVTAVAPGSWAGRAGEPDRSDSSIQDAIEQIDALIDRLRSHISSRPGSPES